MSELKKPLKSCRRCYAFALGLALRPFGWNLGALGVLANQDFKEKFVLVNDHAECQNCFVEAKRFGKCHCGEPWPALKGME